MSLIATLQFYSINALNKSSLSMYLRLSCSSVASTISSAAIFEVLLSIEGKSIKVFSGTANNMIGGEIR